MVLRSQTRSGGSSVAVPDIEVRPEIEFRQELEMDSPAEIEVSASTTCEWGLCSTGPITAEEPPEIAETASTLVLGRTYGVRDYPYVILLSFGL